MAPAGTKRSRSLAASDDAYEPDPADEESDVVTSDGPDDELPSSEARTETKAKVKESFKGKGKSKEPAPDLEEDEPTISEANDEGYEGLRRSSTFYTKSVDLTRRPTTLDLKELAQDPGDRLNRHCRMPNGLEYEEIIAGRQGANMARWNKAMDDVSVLGTAPTTANVVAIGKTFSAFLQDKSVRRVRLRRSQGGADGGTSVTFQDTKTREESPQFWLPCDSSTSSDTLVQDWARTLGNLLERLPWGLTVLKNRSLRKALVTAAGKVSNPNYRVRIPHCRWVVSEGRVRGWSTEIKMFDGSTGKHEELRVNVIPKDVDLTQNLPSIPNSYTVQTPEECLGFSDTLPEHQDLARRCIRILQLLAVRFHLTTVPSIKDARNMLNKAKAQYVSIRNLSIGPYRGKNLIHTMIERRRMKTHFWYASEPLKDIGKGRRWPTITINTLDRRRASSVEEIGTRTWLATFNLITTYTAMSEAADIINQDIREALPPRPYCFCDDEQSLVTVHACAGCGDARTCASMVSILKGIKACRPCVDTPELREPTQAQLQEWRTKDFKTKHAYHVRLEFEILDNEQDQNQHQQAYLDLSKGQFTHSPFKGDQWFDPYRSAWVKADHL